MGGVGLASRVEDSATTMKVLAAAPELLQVGSDGPRGYVYRENTAAFVRRTLLSIVSPAVHFIFFL